MIRLVLCGALAGLILALLLIASLAPEITSWLASF